MSTARFPLPDVGEGLTEAEIVAWRVAPGDTITINQVIVEIETAKSLVEVPSPFAGTVTELLVDEGQTVEVGTPIIAVETAGDAPDPAAPIVGETEADAVADTAASIASEESGSGAVLVGYGTGGAVAEAIGQRLKKLAEATQVIVVTHQPQVAAQAHQHFKVEKRTDGATTHTQVALMHAEARVREVAADRR